MIERQMEGQPPPVNDVEPTNYEVLTQDEIKLAVTKGLESNKIVMFEAEEENYSEEVNENIYGNDEDGEKMNGADMVDSDYEQSDDEILKGNSYDPSIAWKWYLGFNERCENEADVEEVDSDYDNDELKSMSGSSEDEYGNRVERNSSIYLVFNLDIDFNNISLISSLIFSNKKIFIKAIKDFSIKEHREIHMVKNDKRRVRFTCKYEHDCGWYVYAAAMDDGIGFQIRGMKLAHTCPVSFTNKRVTAKWCAEKYIGKFKDQPNWNSTSFSNQVRNDTLVDVNIWTYYRARTFANKAIHGDAKVQFTMLWEYCDELLRSNPRSTVKVKTNCVVRKAPKFERIYIYLNACKRGFLEGCRPLIGLDGCHLKGNHKGQILTAVSSDANNGMYPLACSVVESECKDTWMWFLDLLKVDLKIENDHRITWISGKQKGLEIALNTHFREPERRHCVRHLYNNFKTQINVCT